MTGLLYLIIPSKGDLMKEDNKTKKHYTHELTGLCSQNAKLKKINSREYEEASSYAESIVETVREPLLVLDADLKVILANRNFYRTFEVTADETIGSFIYDLGNKQWDIPKLRELLETILPETATFENDEV
jgi:PAS domain-containing protein